MTVGQPRGANARSAYAILASARSRPEQLQHLEDAGALRAADHRHARRVDEDAGLHAARLGQRADGWLEDGGCKFLRCGARIPHGGQVRQRSADERCFFTASAS